MFLWTLAAASAEAAEHGPGVFPVPNEVLWAIVNFLILFWLLKKFLYKPILGMMSAREKEIETNLAQAAADKAEAQRLRQEFETQMQKARREAQDVVAQATRAANESKEKMLAEARQESETLLVKAQETIQRERDQALAQLRDEIGNLAVAVATKVLEREVSVQDHTRLVKEFVAEVGKH